MKITMLGMIVLMTIILSLSMVGSSIGVFSLEEGMVGQDMMNELESRDVNGPVTGEGVKSSYINKTQEVIPSSYDWSTRNHEAYMSELTNPDIQLGFFDRTEFRPDCCGSHSGRGGCACLSKEQIEFLNTRGGNRTSGEF